MVKPLLRWAGSKKKLIPELNQFWQKDKYQRYIEPFVGSAQLYFSISPKNSIISDINEDLIITYNQIKSNPENIFLELEKYHLTKEYYYQLRNLDPTKLNNNQRAARFIYLNRFCFNGLYRTNSKGKFNVPYAGYKTGNLPDLNRLIEISKELYNTKIICGDFEKVIKSNLKKGDFIYFDPPYAVSNVRMFNQYNPQTFGLNDLKRLSKLLYEIDSVGSKFLVSYAESEEANFLSENWKIKKIDTIRFMKGFGKTRNKAKEILIYN